MLWCEMLFRHQSWLSPKLLSPSHHLQLFAGEFAPTAFLALFVHLSVLCGICFHDKGDLILLLLQVAYKVKDMNKGQASANLFDI